MITTIDDIRARLNEPKPLRHEHPTIKAEIERQIDNRQHFIAQYLKSTKHPIEELMLFEQRMDDGTIRFWVELRDTP